MATATARRPTSAHLTRELREDFARGLGTLPKGMERVDRVNGIIRKVKLCGLESPNKHDVEGVSGTEYLSQALAEALSMYEGALCNVNHPDRDKPNKDRSAYDRFGWFENCVFEEGVPWGDLHVLDPEEPLARRLFAAAEKHPECFCLSHHAFGTGEIRGGKYVVTKINEVKSIDLVADGGTVKSLFESRQEKPKIATKKKFRLLIEATSPATQARFKRLLEMGDYGDIEAESPAAGEGKGGEEYEGHCAEMVKAIILHADMSDAEKIAKIKTALKILGSGDGKKAETDEADETVGAGKKPGEQKLEEGCDDKDKEKKMEESRKTCKRMLSLAGVAPDTELIESLMSMGNDDARLKQIEWLKKNAPAEPIRSQAAGSARPLTETKKTAIPTDSKAQLTWLNS